MIFHIFSSNTKVAKCISRKALLSTTNYGNALDMMYNLSEKYDIEDFKNNTTTYLYLVVDFGVNRTNAIHYITQNDGKDNILPFLIIAERSPSYGLYSRDDTIVFKTGPFTQEFEDNVKAIEKLLYFEKNGIEYDAFIRYIENDTEATKKIVVASNYKINKFNIDPKRWKPNPIVRERKFYNFIMS